MDTAFVVNLPRPFRMASPTQHPDSWFSDPQWLQALQVGQAVDSAALARLRIKGISACHHPPWALETGEVTSDHVQALRRALESSALPLVVCDLPPGFPCMWEKPWIVQQKHTRWLQAVDGQFPPAQAPIKTSTGGLAQGLRLEPCADVELLLSCISKSGNEKSIPSDAAALKRLLSWILARLTNQATWLMTIRTGPR